MKKPNITEGKWKVVARNTHKQYIAQLGIKTIVSDGNPDETEDADAKAIAQVPNMIDALIEAREIIELFADHQEDSLAKIEQVLTDAGCEL